MTTESDFERQREFEYPCIAHGEWLRKLDDRMWEILVAVCAGAIASVVTLLLVLLERSKP